MDSISPVVFAKPAPTLIAKNAQQEMALAISANQLTNSTLPRDSASRATALQANMLIQAQIPARAVPRNARIARQQLA